MVISKKKKIIRNYNKTAFFYDKRYRKIQEQKYQIVLHNYHFNSKLILDAGCGTGLFIDFITSLKNQKDFTPCIYVGTDISLNMLRIFRNKLPKLNLRYKFNLILSDIENLPFRENIFKCIFSLTCFQNLANIKEGMKNLFSVGKDKADLNLSILKKNLNLVEIMNLLNPLIKNLKIINNDNIEDIIIKGKISKGKSMIYKKN